MTLCPNLTSQVVPPGVIASQNIDELILNSYDRNVGAVINLSCFGERILDGPSTIKCLNTGQWNYTYMPTCAIPIVESGLSQDILIIIAVCATIGGLLLLILSAIAIAICLRRRKSNRTKYREPSLYSEDAYKSQPFTMYNLPYTGSKYGVHSMDRISSNTPGSHSRQYMNKAFPLDYDTESPYRLVQKKHQHPHGPRESYHGVSSDRHSGSDMAQFNRTAHMEGRDPFLWEGDIPRPNWN